MSSFVDDVISPRHFRKMKNRVSVYMRNLTVRKLITITICLLLTFTIYRIIVGTYRAVKRTERPNVAAFYPFSPETVDLYEDFRRGGVKSGLTDDTYFKLNGKPLTILGGSLHYFRVVPEYWLDRLTKMKAAGINTVTTYIPWNMHEQVKGHIRFDGILDIVRFLKLAESVGLLAIVRPGPYICSEWDLGGLPYWLLRDSNMNLRTTYKPYMDEVRRYFSVLLPKLAELQFTRGGPIIAFQVENEYEVYATDPDYIPQLTKMMRGFGLNELLFTSDNTDQVAVGTAPGVLRTINGQNGAVRKISSLRASQPGKAVLVTEFWTGWFDQWGYDEPHHLKNLDKYYELIGDMLRAEASINFYMFHGGTNFGFWNGAVGYDAYPYMKPIITSYDYDAPLSESGDCTAKYWQTHSVLRKYGNPGGAYFKLPDTPPDTAKDYYGSVKVHHYMGLESMLSIIHPERHDELRTMEMLDYNSGSGQGYGYIVYKKDNLESGRKLMFLDKVYDRAIVSLNDKIVGTFDYVSDDKEFDVQADFGENSLWVLVENMGRINYGRVFEGHFAFSKQYKGIAGEVTMESEPVRDWLHYPMDFNATYVRALSKMGWRNHEPGETNQGPALYKATLPISLQPKDTFINMKDWRKGCVFVNGFNIGRYWSIGPQLTLYVPAPLLKAGDNEIIIFELEKAANELVFQDRPDLGRTFNMEVD